MVSTHLFLLIQLPKECLHNFESNVISKMYMLFAVVNLMLAWGGVDISAETRNMMVLKIMA